MYLRYHAPAKNSACHSTSIESISQQIRNSTLCWTGVRDGDPIDHRAVQSDTPKAGFSGERVAGCDQRGAHLVAVMSALPAKWPTCARKCTLGAGRANTPFLLHSSCSLCKKAMQPMPSPPQISLTLSPSLSFCPFENAAGSLELISQSGPVQIREGETYRRSARV